MFHDKDSYLVDNLDYQFVKKTSLMITKTLFIPSFLSNCGISWDSLQRNVMHYYYCFDKQLTLQKYH